MRYLGLDIGDKSIGVALSDPLGMLATPLTIIERRDKSADLEAIASIIRENQVETTVVGLPRSMSGDMGIQAEKVSAFAEALRRHTGVKLEMRDERLSTVSARRLMREAGKKSRERDDAFAAALILQGYLDEDWMAGHEQT
ncbi:MAG: Holliday junction resolvase RuvX [Chloroflexi bacterium]|nr:Holliday junction resolvase RuvX [Chloroflexota bacterium]